MNKEINVETDGAGSCVPAVFRVLFENYEGLDLCPYPPEIIFPNGVEVSPDIFENEQQLIIHENKLHYDQEAAVKVKFTESGGIDRVVLRRGIKVEWEDQV